MERAVHKVRRLRQKTGKAVTGQVKEKVPGTSFLIDRSSLPECPGCGNYKHEGRCERPKLCSDCNGPHF